MKTNYLFDEKLIRFTEHNGQFADFIWKIGFIILPLLHDILKQIIMKKTLVFAMLIASVVAMTCCTSDDPFQEYYNNNEWNNGGNMSNGNSATTGELASFDVAIDKTTAELALTQFFWCF